MKLNELSKSSNSKNNYISVAIILLLNFGLLLSAQKEELSEAADKSYVVRVCFRNFYDMKNNNEYNQHSEFNKSGFNSNSKWDSIFSFIKIVNEQDPEIWWFLGKGNPTLMVIKFQNLSKAQSFYNKIQTQEYAFIVKKSALEEFIPNCRIKRK